MDIETLVGLGMDADQALANLIYGWLTSDSPEVRRIGYDSLDLYVTRDVADIVERIAWEDGLALANILKKIGER